VLLIALQDTLGIIGIVIAPPLSVVCQILWSQVIRRRTKTDSATLLSDLKGRMLILRESINAMDEPRLPLITTSIERISNLIDEAEPVLQAADLS